MRSTSSAARHLGRPGVVLVSDLDDDAGDIEALTNVALAYRKLGIPLRVVGLSPSPEDQRLLTRLLEHPSDLRPAAQAGERGAGVDAPSPAPLVVLALAVAASLALLLALTERLRWDGA